MCRRVQDLSPLMRCRGRICPRQVTSDRGRQGTKQLESVRQGFLAILKNCLREGKTSQAGQTSLRSKFPCPNAWLDLAMNVVSEYSLAPRVLSYRHSCVFEHQTSLHFDTIVSTTRRPCSNSGGKGSKPDSRLCRGAKTSVFEGSMTAVRTKLPYPLRF